jgi:hypothetical protein
LVPSVRLTMALPICELNRRGSAISHEPAVTNIRKPRLKHKRVYVNLEMVSCLCLYKQFQKLTNIAW